MADAVLSGSPPHPSTAEIAKAIREERATRGKRAAFLGAFATFVGGEPGKAVPRFDKVIASDPGSVEARYWRSRALAVLEQAQGAGQKTQQDALVGQGSIFDMEEPAPGGGAAATRWAQAVGAKRKRR